MKNVGSQIDQWSKGMKTSGRRSDTIQSMAFQGDFRPVELGGIMVLAVRGWFMHDTGCTSYRLRMEDIRLG